MEIKLAKWRVGFSGDSVIKEPTSQCGEDRFDPKGQEDPLEKEMATHSSILAWEIPWAEELGELQQMGWQRVGHDLATRQSGEFLKKQGRRKRYRQETHQTGFL